MSDRAGRHPDRGGEPERDVAEMDVGDRDGDMILERPVQVQEDQDDDNRDENDPASRLAAFDSVSGSAVGRGVT